METKSLREKIREDILMCDNYRCATCNPVVNQILTLLRSELDKCRPDLKDGQVISTNSSRFDEISYREAISTFQENISNLLK